MRERRRFLRIPESLPLTYELLLDQQIDGCITKDISREGVRFFIHKFVPKYSLLKIRIVLKKVSFSIEALVRVIWIRRAAKRQGYEVGAEYVSIAPEAVKRLSDYIASRKENS